MTLEAVFYPPFKGAEELTYEEIQKDLKNIGVISGISEEAIRLFHFPLLFYKRCPQESRSLS